MGFSLLILSGRPPGSAWSRGCLRLHSPLQMALVLPNLGSLLVDKNPDDTAKTVASQSRIYLQQIRSPRGIICKALAPRNETPLCFYPVKLMYVRVDIHFWHNTEGVVSGWHKGSSRPCILQKDVQTRPRGDDFTVVMSPWSPWLHKCCHNWFELALFWLPSVVSTGAYQDALSHSMDNVLTEHFDISSDQADSIPGTRIPEILASGEVPSLTMLPSQLRRPKAMCPLPLPFMNIVTSHNCFRKPWDPSHSLSYTGEGESPGTED